MEMLNGRELAKNIKKTITEKIKIITKTTNQNPALATVLIGENPASQIYIQSKIKACHEVGIKSYHYNLSTNATERDIINLINDLNNNSNINGILLQLPLPQHSLTNNCINTINPNKDVDGLHPLSYGRFSLLKSWEDILKSNLLVPCTPLGIMKLLQYYNIEVNKKLVLVIGRSNLVGKPIAMLMLAKNATVIMAHSKTVNLKQLTAIADIIIIAIGIPNFLSNKYSLKKGVVIIDVGINRTQHGICGDVDLDYVKTKNVAISPVPGGVGTMTITMLLENTLKAFINQNKLKFPQL
ncbi:MAG: bifunctional 5,10-methylenetetrahydrofolate dehydrogenase/5,10-methenyltetrahydrofolate cyclohydrolase [Endomicrobium sp.]|jgi:methylenetetrahydrofolate dehydrogenase (NADP+)/methenyltetrahydrofolate cyclohydrolase|nr:bifunctional 5,10-methylenetetrahydrofolate dehydrogenase/5,10-methenyltetrahydrofolate cyclohydrolase [Endomicrobium sp.]